MRILYWLRRDLRLRDNETLEYAAARGEVYPVFVVPEGLGGASKWWLHHSLTALAESYSSRGSKLIVATGEPEMVIAGLCESLQIDEVVWGRVYTPNGMKHGESLKARLASLGVSAKSFNSQLLTEPSKLFNKQGTPFKVFTPYWRTAQHAVRSVELDVDLELQSQTLDVSSLGVTIDQLKLLPTKPDWSKGLGSAWRVSEDAAQLQWNEFVAKRINYYQSGRDFPAQEATSLMSPYLAWGQISPQRLFMDIQQSLVANDVSLQDAHKFLAELGWREFSYYQLTHFPHILGNNFNKSFDAFPWRSSSSDLQRWQTGMTGYPIVDAGMRELWQTGYMHNRVRMVVASFLTKHLMIDWRQGMEWFWDTLVDADLANNTASWQWVAGCGADAAPYFRIFNPVLQGEKFDCDGGYTRMWLPELKTLPNKYIHKPWQMSDDEQSRYGLRLGQDYPEPIVEHGFARQRALNAFQATRSQ